MRGSGRNLRHLDIVPRARFFYHDCNDGAQAPPASWRNIMQKRRLLASAALAITALGCGAASPSFTSRRRATRKVSPRRSDT
ncbi:hypothetical protein HMPREF3036_00029 [Sutterella sp. KLE1602]|nr:hypothetical protein HMPREF3036_00029 [Sutterella sp. KLE1602]